MTSKRRCNKLDSLMSPAGDVTELLVAWGEGDQTAQSELMEIVYAELKRLAKAYLRREHANHSLAATALVHEAYLKLVDQRRVEWQNRAHFFAIAAQQMRRILVDHARARGAAKRGAGGTVPLSDLELGVDPLPVDLVALDKALEKLAQIDQRQTRLVELRFFAGLTIEETAEMLRIAPATVKRDWALARTWLYRELQGSSG
jgi:RNA polymerase sigma factor (TIGR02999 family)